MPPQWVRGIRVVWLSLAIAVVAWAATSVILVFVSVNDGSSVFFDQPSSWKSLLLDVQFLAFRIGEGALALLAGTWFYTRLDPAASAPQTPPAGPHAPPP